jgi:hypothetical protein
MAGSAIGADWQIRGKVRICQPIELPERSSRFSALRPRHRHGFQWWLLLSLSFLEMGLAAFLAGQVVTLAVTAAQQINEQWRAVAPWDLAL